MTAAELACARLLEAHLRTGMYWPKTMAAFTARHGEPRRYFYAPRREPVNRAPKAHHGLMPEITCNQRIEDHLGFHGAVMAGIATKAGITVADMTGRCRGVQVVSARKRVAKILRRRGYSLNAIGRVLGGRDHATIMHYLGWKRRVSA